MVYINITAILLIKISGFYGLLNIQNIYGLYIIIAVFIIN